MHLQKARIQDKRAENPPKGQTDLMIGWMWESAYWFVLDEKLIPDLIKGCKIRHISQVHIGLEHMIKGAARLLKDGAQVEQCTAGPILDGAGDNGARGLVDSDDAGAEDETVVDGCLGELGQRRWCTGGADDFLRRHDFDSFSQSFLFRGFLSRSEAC